jgi:flagellar biosynthesis protein FlgN
MQTASPLSTLRDEKQLITTLLDLLKQEQQILVRADSDGLTSVTPLKSSLVTQLGQLAGQRHAALGAAGFAAREEGMQAWLDASPDKAAASLWQDLLAITREAKEVNRVNGMLITKHLSHNQAIINAMRQPAARGGEQAFYGPTGQATSSGPSRRYVVG